MLSRMIPGQKSLSRLRADLVAGLTVAAVAVPQAMAYAVIAGVHPRHGLYAAILPVIVAALAGSSRYLVAGPTNAIAMLTASTMAAVSLQGTPLVNLPEEARLGLVYLLAAMTGAMQFSMGLARLGSLVNFISHSVVVGFTAGAGALIAVNQLKNLLGVSVPASPFLHQTVAALIQALPQTNPLSAGLGVGAILFVAALRRWRPALPGPFLAVALGGALVWLFDLAALGVRTVGEIPRSLPPLTIPTLTFEAVNALFMPALAVAILGLVEALAIAKSLASLKGERVDGDREFVAQGLANVAAAFTGAIPGSGSFTRSAVNCAAGATSRFASALSGLFCLAALLLLAPGARHIPLPVLAGLLLVVAWAMIDKKGALLAWRATTSDRLVMLATFLHTLFLELEKAVFVGVFLSIVLHLRKAAHPLLTQVTPVGPAHKLKPWKPGEPRCPQAEIFLLEGSLFFGAVNELEERLYEKEECHWNKSVILSLKHVRLVDATGLHALERFAAKLMRHGARLILVGPNPDVLGVIKRSGLMAKLGEVNVVGTIDEAIALSAARYFNPRKCEQCETRVFWECLDERHSKCAPREACGWDGERKQEEAPPAT